MAILETISGVPDAARGFVYWLIFINSLSIFFVIRRAEARAIFAGWAAVVLIAMGMAEREMTAGPISAAAAAIWLPLLFWLVWRNPVEDAREPWGLYLILLFASNLVASVLAFANLWFRAIP